MATSKFPTQKSLAGRTGRMEAGLAGWKRNFSAGNHCGDICFSTGWAKREGDSFLTWARDIEGSEFEFFLLSGPGSGKGTQCPKIVEQFGSAHLCVGDLLQAEIESESENGTMIQNFKKEGKIVPSEITVKLLQLAMQQSDNKRFIIDGFPRNEENRTAFENIIAMQNIVVLYFYLGHFVMKIEPERVLFFDCPEEELTKRILNRNQGRVDDNIETIRKRLEVYFESTVPVINYYNSKGKVQKIDAQRSIDEVFEDVKSIFSELKPVAKDEDMLLVVIGRKESSTVFLTIGLHLGLEVMSYSFNYYANHG
ncbi:unnamed protein product [Dovyalis caffra]|uniref:UMP-CMP kinase n=1 Tax=Dovyalis caffra TaxID=77055 RepID=A0AAV1SED4_9ROSI|nr:unnamed protein product [Dovyalis caffra]